MEEKKNLKEKGITLVALVITIIILLILVGITIVSLEGENGVISKAKLAKEKYSISETKEKLEFEIAELKIEEEGKGATLTKEDLFKMNNGEIHVGSVESFPVEVIYGKYKFNVDENFIVTYVGEADGTIVTYTTEPEGYTNQDKVQILIKITNSKGIKEIIYPDGDKLEVGGATERGIDYTVTANGKYTFKVIDNNNKEVTKNIVIDKIDKLKPITATIKEKNVLLESFTIQIIAEDAEEDGINSKSGIGKCDFYIKSSSDTDYIKYESNDISYNFTKLTKGETYSVYATVYDKAGNYINTSVTEITTLAKPLPPLAKLIFDESKATVETLEYPILTSEGVMTCEVVPKVGENITLEITSKETTNITYYYSLDGGTIWNKYTGIVNTQYVSKNLIRTKAVYNESGDISITSKENIIKKYKKDLTKECMATDSLKNKAFDGNENTYEKGDSKKLLIDRSAIGLNIKTIWQTPTWRVINIYDDSNKLLKYSPNFISTLTTYVLKIPDEASYILVGYDSEAKCYEIQITEEKEDK